VDRVRAVVLADGVGWGGAQVYARSLARHAPTDVAVHVVTTPEHAPRFAGWAPVHVAPTALRGDGRELQRLLRRLGPDVVQVNLVDPSGLVPALEAAQAVAPTVATLHLPGAVEDDVRTRAAYARLAALVAASAQCAAFARDRLGVPESVHVLNGVDPLPRLPAPAGDVPVVGALGRLTRQKGFDVLLEAVRLLVARGQRVQVLLGGTGREQEALQAQARGLPVTLLGSQDGAAHLVARSDLFCLSSRQEALPLVLLEALSAGRAAVSTDVGDVRRALGDVVRVVPPEDPEALADALAATLADASDRASRGERGASRVRELFTAQRMARQAWQAFLAPLRQPVRR
jgi:glycosyltransferase involved in cell wall biosynthesis